MNQLTDYRAHILPADFNLICLQLQRISEILKTRYEVSITRQDVRAVEDRDFAVSLQDPARQRHGLEQVAAFSWLQVTRNQSGNSNSDFCPPACWRGCETQMRYSCVRIWLCHILPRA